MTVTKNFLKMHGFINIDLSQRFLEKSQMLHLQFINTKMNTSNGHVLENNYHNTGSTGKNTQHSFLISGEST